MEICRVLLKSLLFLLAVETMSGAALAEQDWPALPDRNAAVEIPAQEWPQRPGPRHVRVSLYFPGGTLERVTSQTGVMLTLHNWGGEDCVGTADPQTLANRLNVVAICVNYLQSGRKASIDDPEPYDFGYLQALDALRALWFVQDGLSRADLPFDVGRTYCTGGSGGGNVTLMANKLAPRTFACVIDLCGMAKLNHDIAFNLPGGSGLNARWSRDPNSRNYLSGDEQEIRFVGHSRHLTEMKRLGTTSKIIVVHGLDDTTCPLADAQELVANLRAAEFDVEPKWVTVDDLDGHAFTSTGHALGNRTEIVFRVAAKYLSPDSPDCQRRPAPHDFGSREEVRYATSGGDFVISFANGFPVGRFDPAPPPIVYDEHQDLSYRLDREGQRHAIETVADWHRRREHILENLQQVTGRLPAETMRVPLDVKVIEETHDNAITRRKISFQSDPFDRVSAWLLQPTSSGQPLPAVLCLHQTVSAGKDEPAGLTGSSNMHYAIELTRRGFVTLVPDYPSLGEHDYDFAAHPEFVSGTMKAIWDNLRSVDLLTSLPEVDAHRIGVIGHSLGGHNAIFTAAFDPRLKAIVSSCGFTRFHKDDVPSWTGARYMPRIASQFGSDADRLPFDFPELVACLAPRAFLVVAATQDDDFDMSGVRDTVAAARSVYSLFGQPERLQADYPDSPHDFPNAARERAYQFLAEHLQTRVRDSP